MEEQTPEPAPGVTEPALVRLRLDLSYDGTDFAGWAPQPTLRTVCGELTSALATVLRREGGVHMTVAGRTDAGVHARGQVAHVDVTDDELARMPGRSDRAPEAALVSRLTGILAPDGVVRRVTRAPAGFDARFGATQRRYLYRLAPPDATRDPLRRRDTVWWRRPLDVEAMDAASASLTGLRDFAAFCRRREGASTIRTLVEYSWRRDDDGVLLGTVRADAFCHSMVRSLVGAVVRVGEGAHDVDWPAAVQVRGERGAGVVMPAHGLSLEEVTYPADAELTAQAARTMNRRRAEEVTGPDVSGAVVDSGA